MLRYNQLKNALYNQLGRTRYNSNAPKRKQLYNRLAGARPVVFNQNEERLGVLENADEPILEQEIGSVDTFTFTLPYKDPKKKLIKNENYIQLVDDRYIIRNITKIRSGSSLEIEVFCEATWYDLQRAEPMEVWEWVNATPEQIMLDMLRGTEWSVGIVEVTDERNLSLNEGLTNRLKGLRELPEVFTGELNFNTDTNTVDFLEPMGEESGASIVYKKNMDSIEVDYSTEELVTKLYLYGKDNMTIEDAHPDGLSYIENYQYTNKKLVLMTSDERFTNPFHLYDQGVDALDVLSRPTGSYVLTAFDLSIRSGLSHEQFFLGNSVWVYDSELELNERKRIMKWKYNVKRPWDTEIELESPQPTISDLLTGEQSGSGFLQSEDSVDEDDMLNLSVFNYLLNSRADDGFSYWANTGWEVDPVNGYSGNASFKAVGESGVKKEMTQEVFPSHRDEYAISFRASTNDVTLNANGRVGVYVTIKYDDGTQDEPVFIPLIEG
ncbi:phage tail spike protein [Virgibacillus sp. CBA3643]|uniref:phage tail spike protein n=1 Tax=Virgibacillus sp. CBA3643 TaxID=2942278 RepID=UPI0035A3C962